VTLTFDFLTVQLYMAFLRNIANEYDDGMIIIYQLLRSMYFVIELLEPGNHL